MVKTVGSHWEKHGKLLGNSWKIAGERTGEIAGKVILCSMFVFIDGKLMVHSFLEIMGNWWDMLWEIWDYCFRDLMEIDEKLVGQIDGKQV